MGMLFGFIDDSNLPIVGFENVRYLGQVTLGGQFYPEDVVALFRQLGVGLQRHPRRTRFVGVVHA